METTKILPSSIVQRTKDILFSRLDDELLFIDAKTEYCYSLNETASRAWELISSPMQVEVICRRFVEEFNVDKVTCERDVIELFQHLSEAGMIRVCDATAT